MNTAGILAEKLVLIKKSTRIRSIQVKKRAVQQPNFTTALCLETPLVSWLVRK